MRSGMGAQATGASAPAFGTYHIPLDQVSQAVGQAVEAGYRRFDSAASYGNDSYVGRALAGCGVRREELFITSKLWNDSRAYDAAIRACRKTLKRLKVDRLDQYLIHWPASPALYDDWHSRNAETWRAMETLKRDGLVGRIGLSNFLAHHIERLMPVCALPPEVNQIEFHPGQPQTETVSLCKRLGIDLEAWSPLGGGAALRHPLVQAVAAAHGRSAAQVCLCFCIQSGLRPVCRSTSPERMRENLALSGLSLTPEEMAALSAATGIGCSGLDPDAVTQFG